MLSRTQYNVNDYFKKCVDSTFHLGHGFEYDRIDPDFLEEQNSNS